MGAPSDDRSVVLALRSARLAGGLLGFEVLAVNWFEKTLTGAVLRRKFGAQMKGWKTWLGGLALVLSGAGVAVVGVTQDFDMDKVTQGLAMIGAGFAAWGIGHKIEKAQK